MASTEDPAALPASGAEEAAPRAERPARGRQVVNALRQKAKDFVKKNTPSPLQVQLKRATHAEVISVPKSAVEDVVKASSTMESRREIMRHVHACLAEESSAHWRRVYLGLELLDALLKDGPEDLLSETANGHHFDLVQRLSFLDRYEYSFDDRVESMIRKRAAQLREAWLQRQLEVDANFAGGLAEVLNPGSGPKAAPAPAPSLVARRAADSAPWTARGDEPAKPGPIAERRVRVKPFLNGVASVGHNEDTSDDESDAEDAGVRAVKPAPLEKECSSNASTSACDVGSSNPSAGSSPRAAAEPPQLLDLLGSSCAEAEEGLSERLPPADILGLEATTQSASPAPCEDLLDLCTPSTPQPTTAGEELLPLDVGANSKAEMVNCTTLSAAGTSLPAGEGIDWLAVATSKGISFDGEAEDLI